MTHLLHKIKHEPHLPVHVMPASSWWPQLWFPRPLWGHCSKESSEPEQARSSRVMEPVPCPNWAIPETSRASPQPSSLHTTWASCRSQPSSHTEPHWPEYNTSTLPEQLLGPLTRRTLVPKETSKFIRHKIKIICLIVYFKYICLSISHPHLYKSTYLYI